MSESSGFSLNYRSTRPTAKSRPKWAHVGSNMLQSVSNPHNVLIWDNGKWRSATKMEIKRVTG